MSVKENLLKIKEQIGNNNVKIIAVTKYAKWDQIFEACSFGIYDFGESYVQDALEKLSQNYQGQKLENLIRWHFIGRLQKNKAKFIVGRFFLIHSVDSTELAKIINKIAVQKEVKQNILLQVNLTEEPQKGGFNKDDLKKSIKELLSFPNINIQGLMTIGPKTENTDEIRKCFLNLKDIKSSLEEEHNISLNELSMGMSNDYKLAIECGSTMIRIGRILFKKEE